MNFEDLIAKVKTCGKQKLAVAAAEDDAVLEAVDAAHEQGIADAILVGDEAAIRKIAAELNIDLSDYEIINEPDKVQASLKAVKLAHDGVANMYMKGLLDTKTFLKSVLDKEVGLRTGNTLSHVAVFEIKGIEQLLFLTDVAFMTYPTLEDKVHIIENTVAVAHACGVECPKVAPLAAVEVVNPKMPCTVDADELGTIDIPEHIQNYFDYEAYGRDVRINEGGARSAWDSGITSTDYSKAVKEAMETWECTVGGV